jgi:hypothetical protein
VYREYYVTPLARYTKPEITLKPLFIARESPDEQLPEKLVDTIKDSSQNSPNIYLVLCNPNTSISTLLLLINKTHKLQKRKSFHGAIEIFGFHTNTHY